MKTPFRNKASQLLQRIVKQRLFLIETGKSKNFITWDQCKQVENEISRLKSDKQFASYVLTKGDFLLNMVPGNNKTNAFPLRMLIESAKDIQT